MNALRAISDRLSNILFAISCFLILLMALHIFADVISKNLFNKPLLGTVEVVTGYYMVAACFLPLAAVQLKREHLIVEAFTTGLSDHTKLVFDFFARLIALALTLLLTWQSVIQALKKTKRGEFKELAEIDLIIWPARWFVAVGFLVFAFILLVQLIELAGRIRNPNRQEEMI